ncbi:hypothetical protein Lalb_Chr20g0108221 [Lupinus albus]|uniref:Uncharacterized protein n=1 Tax=Lupinus albus TaxID=3870 RepID=A0A6A4NS71_LUPAL|nr:hypothetical protein Lalb_Chr20g0108221 [Lupinus albus]
MAITSLTISILATGANTSSKSKPCFCRKPLATNLALYLATVPSGFSFTLYTHLTEIAFFPFGSDVSSHVLLFSIEPISSFIASIQCTSLAASSKVIGSISANSAICTKSPSVVIEVSEKTS